MSLEAALYTMASEGGITNIAYQGDEIISEGTEGRNVEKLYLEGEATWVNKVELLRQYGTMRGNQSMIFPKSQAT